MASLGRATGRHTFLGTMLLANDGVHPLGGHTDLQSSQLLSFLISDMVCAALQGCGVGDLLCGIQYISWLQLCHCISLPIS